MNERTETAPQQTAGSSEGTSCLVCSQLLARLLRADAPSAPCGRAGMCLWMGREVPSEQDVAFFLQIICLSGIKCISLQKHAEKRNDTIL